MKDKNSGISYSLIFAILLTVAFVVLKLCKVISWSWWWVVSPLWIDRNSNRGRNHLCDYNT